MRSQKGKPATDFHSFEELFEQVEKTPDYWAERARLEFTREIMEKMEREGISRGDLARRLQVQPGMVTRLLSGRNNFELKTMVRIAMALGCRFRSHLEPAGAKTRWVEVYETDCFEATLSTQSELSSGTAWNAAVWKPLESASTENHHLHYAPVPAAA
jgi:transcriptional regulator with XRE-family HTH domain